MRRKANRRGLFLVLEGLDGAGTTTQTERLARALRERGHSVITTREPSDGPIGVLIRQALTGRLQLPGGQGPLAAETLALLFAADRTDHLKATVLPALEQGKVVISDRYLLSSLAYQGSSLEMEWVAEANRFAISPDLTLFVEVGVKVAASRRAGRGGAEELFEAEQQQRKIARQYAKAVALRQGKERIVTVDGERSPDQVTAALLSEIDKLAYRLTPARNAR